MAIGYNRLLLSIREETFPGAGLMRADHRSQGSPVHRAAAHLAVSWSRGFQTCATTSSRGNTQGCNAIHVPPTLIRSASGINKGKRNSKPDCPVEAAM
ncbi:hypothetical protein IG631_16737 [Alternaria alternata]|nr:hypothetical protein IG631_16737 [Alternaria alternata]